ncbi:MAG: ATP synthase subunit I, partial [Ramlibacter sp.]
HALSCAALGDPEATRVFTYNQGLCAIAGRSNRRQIMKTIAPLPGMEDEVPFKPMTAEQARNLRERNPPISPWWVIAGQVVVGSVVALAAWALTGRQNVGWSAGYGALAVAIPAAVFARGLTSRFSSLNAVSATAGFMLWEMVKLALTVALSAAAPRLVAELSWPALLVGLVLAMKVYWVALAYRPRKRKLTTE